MPSTTNFGWTTPADTDLVKDGAAAIRTLGNGVDTSFVDLKGGTTGQILSKNSNTDLDFVWIANDQGDITAVTAGTGLTGGGTSGAVTVSLSSPVAETLGGTAQTTYATGDLLYASAADTLAKRTIGTTGQVLTVSGGVPTWATPAGGGKVLQVVQATTTTETAVSGSTFGDSGLSASITPSSTSSKVLIFTMQQVYIQRTNENRNASFRIVRGSTEIVGTRGGLFGASGIVYLGPCFVYLDSPSTTSSTTYKTQGKGDGSDSTTTFQTSNSAASTGVMVLMEIGA